MIRQATLIDEPKSGKYKERIYDIPNSSNSGDWTWVMFTNDDLAEWCGNFRGFPRGVALSERHQVVLVLTSDYLFKLDVGTGDLLDYVSEPGYRCLTVSPSGEFIVANDYHIDLLHPNLQEVTTIPPPIEVDMIAFVDWHGKMLSISCTEFLDINQAIELELDSETYEIVFKDPR
ncbi:hypothetical protein [Planococcus donghaensis]|uniref:Uncharacterized protein n=1 Tax=Planococcus donghaensis TaxID=414778 RepID=A0A1C7EJ76_9BACL|nr:hypothetical protein [Planococcus donghaensis]ANU23392.1 hypothetical protein BCM40_08415 [Planococcus donghaensis]